MDSSIKPIRVAVVDDCPHDRDRIVRLLKASPGFACTAVCASGQEALQTLPGAAVDVVLLDIEMAGMSGIKCAQELKAKVPQAEIMMLTVVEDHERIYQALAAGATGYLLKKTPPAQLLAAVRELRAGGAPMSGQIARQVVAAFRKPADANPAAAEHLTPLEQKVLQLLARGLLYKEIAHHLQISPGTVRTHIWHIYRKLHVHNRTEAVLIGLGRTPRC